MGHGHVRDKTTHKADCDEDIRLARPASGKHKDLCGGGRPVVTPKAANGGGQAAENAGGSDKVEGGQRGSNASSTPWPAPGRCSDHLGGEDNAGGVLCTQENTPYSAPTGQECKGRGLVLVKTFKTASTTLASYITQIGSQGGAEGGGCYFLHPKSRGWFEERELESRLWEGQRFDMSVRHITPYTPYETLSRLLPGAVFVTIMREPVDRFLSLFNFRHNLKRKYKTPEALVQAVKDGKLSSGDSRPFCNQFAWLLSGKDEDYTRVDTPEEAERVAKDVMDTVSSWNVTVLFSEKMSQSVAVLVDRMGLAIDELQLRLESRRVQKRSLPSARHSHSQAYYYTCDAASPASDTGGGHHKVGSNACRESIRSCNLVDEILYKHYEKRFQEVLDSIPGLAQAVEVFNKKPHATKTMSALEVGRYPINCVTTPNPQNGDPSVTKYRDPGSGAYERLHSCRGHLR